MTSTNFAQLRAQLELLRDQAVARTMTEADVWRMLDKTSRMLDKSKGGDGEDLLRIIYTLLSTVWQNTRTIDRLHDLAG